MTIGSSSMQSTTTLFRLWLAKLTIIGVVLHATLLAFPCCTKTIDRTHSSTTNYNSFSTDAFVVGPPQLQRPLVRLSATEEKAAPLISGADLEVMLTEWDTPLVVDAYATWCGPCLLMAPEFEEAAQALKGKVRFAKLDTDKDEAMAARLNIMGLPTLLFLDKYEAKPDEEDMGARAVLKGRIEGALRKQNILDLCEFHFFGGPEPKL